MPAKTSHGFLVAIALFAACPAATATGDRPIIREEKAVTVEGKAEIWRLEWKTKPTPACGADDAEISLTCPCSGFAFGEQGPLTLVRIRSDGSTEHLELGPLFEKKDNPVVGAVNGQAILQRWAPIESTGSDGDFERAHENDFATQVASRPVADVMQFSDFDHDGQATEFLFQVATLPCGKHQMVLIGVSKANPHLHVFASAEKPDEPLILGSWEWEALKESRGPIDVTDWPCGDHASEVEWRVHLWANSGVIHATKTHAYCAKVKQSSVYPEILKLNDLYDHGKLSQQEFSNRELELLRQVMESAR